MNIFLYEYTKGGIADKKKTTMKSDNFPCSGIIQLVLIKLIAFLIILFGKDQYLFYGPNGYTPPHHPPHPNSYAKLMPKVMTFKR